MIRTILFIICFTARKSQPITPQAGSGKVYILDKSSFHSQIVQEKNHVWLVLFHSPHCGICQKFKSLFHKIASENITRNTKFGEINCKVQIDLCRVMRVNSFPTLHMYKDGQMRKLEGSCTEDIIKNFIKEGFSPINQETIPQEPPTLFEQFFSNTDRIFDDIHTILTTGHIFMKTTLIAFLLAVGILTGACLYCMFDLFRNSQKEVLIGKISKLN